MGGELSLIGTHCPGSVNFTCVGTGLTSLRWSYIYDNTEVDLATFLANDAPIQHNALPSPFTSVALLHVTRYTNPQFANFTSVLTANLVQLQQESIRKIKCGDPGTVNLLPVNFSIQEQVIPNKPQINGIVATYENTQLDGIQITWTRSTVSYNHNNVTAVYRIVSFMHK